MPDARLSFRTMGEMRAPQSRARVRRGIVCNGPAFAIELERVVTNPVHEVSNVWAAALRRS